MRKKERDAKKRENQARQREAEEKNNAVMNSRKDQERNALGHADNSLKKFLINIWNEEGPKEVMPSGIEWSSGATRLLATKLANDSRIESVILNRKSITDEEGTFIIQALKNNKTVRKLQLDGNLLSTESLKALIELVSKNETLQFLSLECNKLFTTSGVPDLRKFFSSLKTNQTLLSLNISHNNIQDEILPHILSMLEDNDTIINLELNNLPLSNTLQMRKIQNLVMRN